MLSYRTWNEWRFDLEMYYDRAVSPVNRTSSLRDFLLSAWQVRAGSVEVVYGSGRLRAGPGDWVLIPPGVARRHRFTQDAVIRSIRCAIVDATGQVPGAGLPPTLIPDGHPALVAAADRLAATIGGSFLKHSSLLDARSWAALQAEVLHWCVAACDQAGIPLGIPISETRIALAQQCLLERPSPSAIPWDRLHTATGLSRAQLDRLFRQHCGGSVRAGLEDRLLADACRALRDLAEPVKAVSARLGFGDPSHFCRWFRQRAGASPAEWRRRGST